MAPRKDDVSREEFEGLQTEVKEIKKEITTLKILFETSFERLNGTLRNIEDFMRRETVYQRESCGACKEGLATRIEEAGSAIKTNTEEIAKLKISNAKFTGAATLAGALSGLATGVVLKLIFK